jgi:S-formylglutathione hydrolase FrmB
MVKDIPLIVVLPDADNSWYVNSTAEPSKRFEEYLLNDLRTAVEKRYRVDTTRRSVAGLSMGGYGAILYALKRPDLFRFAGSLSGAIPFPRFMDDTVRQPGVQRLQKSLSAAFGTEPNAHRDANDVLVLARSLDTSRIPYIYMATGIQDGFKGFLPVHRMLADTLRAAGIPYELHETRGGHSWVYWGREIRPLIQRMRQVLGF